MRLLQAGFLICTVALAVCGCQSTPEQRLIGAWSTDRDRTVLPDLPSGAFDGRLRRQLYNVQLKLSADHTFSLSGLSQLGGTWKYENDSLVLTPQQNGAPMFGGAFLGLRTLKVDREFTSLTYTTQAPFLGSVKLVLVKTA